MCIASLIRGPKLHANNLFGVNDVSAIILSSCQVPLCIRVVFVLEQCAADDWDRVVN